MCSLALLPQVPAERTSPRNSLSERIVEREIAFHMTVSADRRRIFDALTLPEYIETWLSLPGDHSDCQTIASRTDDGYRLEHYHAKGRLDFSISGAYRVCRRGKLLFTWHKHPAGAETAHTEQSLVSIRINGAFAESTLLLTHTGLFSESDYDWTRDLWALSLTKLQTIFSTP
ncbi:MAG TPA: SRPBCC domain-containing protein [Terracidiphilus sp.]|nr:SRPBCC domain-containing protein [Terracidiphilus sp.]